MHKDVQINRNTSVQQMTFRGGKKIRTLITSCREEEVKAEMEAKQNKNA